MSEVKVKLFAMAKDEATYIPQWVFHHLYFGFDEIEIWLNNITDSSEEICNKLVLKETKFKFRNVDNILKEYQDKNLPFQHILYNQIFKEELAKRDFTHLFFLDIDEFWIPKDFCTTIHDVVQKFSLSDTLSFSWYIDDATYWKLPFEKLLSENQNLYKNKHVKSLVKITDKVETSHAHNSIVRDGVSSHSDGSLIEVNETNSYGGFISEPKLIATSSVLDDYFILHAIYKSQIEYVASLFKGLRQDGLSNILKTNREGYQKGFENLDLPIPINFSIKKDLLNQYYSNYQLFIEHKQILYELLSAQINTVLNYNKVINYVTSNKELILTKYSHLFKGVVSETFSPIIFRYSIDNVEFLGEQSILQGWTTLHDSRAQIRFYHKRDNLLIEVLGILNKIDRPDVLKTINNNIPLKCGFTFTFPNTVKPERVILLETNYINTIKFLIED